MEPREAGGRVKFAYVVPSFANPTGETLSLAARERLLDLAAELDIPVIEDAAYAALRFEGEALPPILALEVARRGSIDARAPSIAARSPRSCRPACASAGSWRPGP